MITQKQYILSLKVNSFKQYIAREFEFHEKVNIITGKNGVGKTNLLDAIYYCCFLKSYFHNSDNLVFNFDYPSISLHAKILKQDSNHFINIKYSKEQKKQITINEIPIEKQTEIAGKYPIVFIEPYDQELIHGSSEKRRKFIDITLSLSDANYLTKLIEYQRIIKQKNALLKLLQTQQTIDITLLNIYDTKLIELNTYIFEQRQLFIEQFNLLFKKYYVQIFNGTENAYINYESSFTNHNIKEFLSNKRAEELKAQKTLYGVHTDDIHFFLNDYLAKKTASQGQQKTIVLATKIAQYEYIKNLTNTKPILFLDDIFDKLDIDRIKSILQLVNNDNFGQIFITYTDANRILSILQTLDIDDYKHLIL